MYIFLQRIMMFGVPWTRTDLLVFYNCTTQTKYIQLCNIYPRIRDKTLHSIKCIPGLYVPMIIKNTIFQQIFKKEIWPTHFD
jgi:hypothetical protein